MNIDLKGKKAMVCGSTQGIGKAIALSLAQLGAEITLVARNEARLMNALEDLSIEAGQKHDFWCVDFEKPDKLQQKLEDHDRLHHQTGWHILINNTGGPPAGLAIDAEPEQFLQAFHNHLICNHLLVQKLVPFMKRNGYGRIVNIISTSVKEPIIGLGVSNTIRGAVASWAKTLATELAPSQITVNNVLPGATKTQRLEAIIANKAQKTGKTLEQVSQEMQKEIPMGRFADTEEIASVVAFLCSPAASYITGINLPIDGGRLHCL